MRNTIPPECINYANPTRLQAPNTNPVIISETQNGSGNQKIRQESVLIEPKKSEGSQQSKEEEKFDKESFIARLKQKRAKKMAQNKINTVDFKKCLEIKQAIIGPQSQKDDKNIDKEVSLQSRRQFLFSFQEMQQIVERVNSKSLQVCASSRKEQQILFQLQDSQQNKTKVRVPSVQQEMIEFLQKLEKQTFIKCDIRYFNFRYLRAQAGEFPIIVMDPPWRIKGAQRYDTSFMFSNSKLSFKIDNF